jgi:hypothetical protein
MSGVVICALWDESDKSFRSRHYHAWDRACSSCGRKVVVSHADKRQIDADVRTKILCEQCALVRWQELTLELPSNDGSAGVEEDSCAACQELKRQEEAAAMEWARCKGLPDRDADQAAQARWQQPISGSLGAPV